MKRIIPPGDYLGDFYEEFKSNYIEFDWIPREILSTEDDKSFKSVLSIKVLGHYTRNQVRNSLMMSIFIFKETHKDHDFDCNIHHDADTNCILITTVVWKKPRVQKIIDLLKEGLRK